MSVINANPSVLFGFGTWEQIKDTFLLAAGNNYEAGSVGGEAIHTLTVDEIPSHNHTASLSENGAHTHQIGADKDAVYNSSGGCYSVHRATTGADYILGATTSNGNHIHDITINNIGGNVAHNNMPPYLAVYIWKRTS